MEHTLNILPIEFGKGGLFAQRIGPESNPDIAKQIGKGAFAHNGWVMRWANPTQGAQCEVIQPWEVPDAATPELLRLLHPILASLSKASLHSDHIRLWPTGHAKAIQIHIHHDPGHCHSAIVLMPEDQASLPRALAFASDKLFGREIPSMGAHLSDEFLRTQSTITESPLVFSTDGTQTSIDAQTGLRNLGPYDKRHLTELHLLFFSQPGCDSAAARLAQELAHGIDHVQSAAAIWVGGMKRVFRVNVQLRRGNDDPDQRISQAQELQASRKPMVVLHVGNEEDAGLHAELLQHGFALEHLPASLAMDSDENRAVALFNAALRIYSKAGGSPWLLHHPRTADHELVIGLGTALVGQQHYGYATVFSSQGLYQLGEASVLAKGESFAQKMAARLSILLQNIRHQTGWQTGQTKRIIFHLDQALDLPQREAIRSGIVPALGAELHFEFHFLHLHHQHPFRWWRTNAPIHGPEATLGLSRQPTYAPSRFLRLLQLDPKELPLAVADLDASNSNDMDYLAHQIHYFSKMSWASTDPAPLPVTLLYGQTIARLTERWLQLGIQLPQPIPPSLINLPWYL